MTETSWAPPALAAFVSSVIEGGVSRDGMAEIRSRLTQLALASYDCLPPLIDALATHIAKASRTLPS